MSLFNKDCSDLWDGSFEIIDDKVVWTASIHPATIFFNFLFPADHMTDNVLPLLLERNLLVGIPLQVAFALNEEYRDARTVMAPWYAKDMENIILFLTRRRPNLKPFELLWCAIHATVEINIGAYERIKRIPTTIRERVKRDAVAQARGILHNPQFNYVGPLLGHALKALEVYVRPLTTGSSSFTWIDAKLLGGLHDIHELSLDGAKARKTLFEYVQRRHPGVETLWHSLVQMYSTYDVTNFPGYGTQPMSTRSHGLWELFFRHIREDVPLQYPQAKPSVVKQKDNLPKSQGLVEEGEQKKSKRKRKSKSKSGSNVAPVEDPAVSKEHPPQDQPVPEEKPPEYQALPEEQPPPYQSVPEKQPASPQQSPAATVETHPSLPAVPEPHEKSEQKLSKKDRKNMRKKLKKLEAAQWLESSVAEEGQPPVIGNDDNDGGDATGTRTPIDELPKDDNRDSIDEDDGIGEKPAEDLVDSKSINEDPVDSTSVNEDPAREDSSDEEPAAQNCKAPVANVYAGILAEKRTLHGSGGNSAYPEEEDHVRFLSSWEKVGVRKNLPQKQKQRKNNRNIVPNTTSRVPSDSKPLPAKAKAPVSSAKSSKHDTEPRSTKVEVSAPHEATSKPRKDSSNVTVDQPTSWSALFSGSRDEESRPSPQHPNVSTNTADALSLETSGMESQRSFEESFPPLGSLPPAQSETPTNEEVPKGPAAHSTTALPEDDDVSVDSFAVRDTDMSHVEQWLMSKYASAFDGLTQAEIENARWRPEQSSVTVGMDRFTV
ncbi:hypothetical protein ACET3X_002980 [Alternaria dauci]|uniref:Uncharacterized protein n=1 Tax=Alternaria dauci TaxID=48095 RepID=A0ABR3US93_9PLEO